MNLIKTALYGLAFLWTLLITALIGNVIHEANGGNPSQINYCMFVAVLSWIVLAIGFVGSFIETLPPLVLLAADAVAVFFTFIAAVLLSAKLGVHSCFDNDYILNNDTIYGPNLTKHCQELQASTAFFWFLFATYCAALVLGGLSSRSTGLSSRGGIRRGGPSMSQV